MLHHVNGLDFNVEVTGAGEPPLLLLHGFTGSLKSWLPHLPVFAAARQVIAVDVIGHGLSSAPDDPARYSMEHAAQDLATLLDCLAATQVDLLGYSMGARLALYFALHSPKRVHALALESGSPGIPEASERSARRRGDEELARSIERDGLKSFVDYWEHIPLFASQLRLPAKVRSQVRRQRLAGSAAGLANSLRGMGTGSQPSLWDQLSRLGSPTLLLAGELDPKYVQIARQMAALLPNASAAIVPDAGHTVHLEQPHAFDRLVLQFLRDPGPVTPSQQLGGTS